MSCATKEPALGWLRAARDLCACSWPARDASCSAQHCLHPGHTSSRVAWQQTDTLSEPCSPPGTHPIRIPHAIVSFVHFQRVAETNGVIHLRPRCMRPPRVDLLLARPPPLARCPLFSLLLFFPRTWTVRVFDAPWTLTCFVELAFGARCPLTWSAVWCCRLARCLTTRHSWSHPYRVRKLAGCLSQRGCPPPRGGAGCPPCRSHRRRRRR